jgi:hypothetical protein
MNTFIPEVRLDPVTAMLEWCLYMLVTPTSRDPRSENVLSATCMESDWMSEVLFVLVISHIEMLNYRLLNII